MSEEDEEFNRIEREAKQRMEAVNATLDRKAKNARELGLDYVPAKYSDIVSDGGFDPRNKFDAPLKRTWIGLTPHERMMCRSYDIDTAIEKTEAKLKEKNEM